MMKSSMICFNNITKSMFFIHCDEKKTTVPCSPSKSHVVNYMATDAIMCILDALEMLVLDMSYSILD